MKNINLYASILMCLSVNCTSAMAEGDMSHDHSHHQMPMSAKTERSLVNIDVPGVQVVRQDGKSVSLIDELDAGRVQVVSFMYTTCTAICPMTSQTIYKLQEKLGADLERVHLVSISIDPEQDTPQKLAQFATKYNAKSAWNFYTGTESASVKIQKAMDVYRGDKMNHVPVTFLRGGNNKAWVRIDGFATPDQLLHEVHSLL